MTEDTDPAVLGTAEELGVAVCRGVDPSEVTIYEDGTHEGRIVREHTDETVMCNTDRQNYTVVRLSCPCGHFLRETHLHHHKPRKRVKCVGKIKDVEALRAELPEETTTEQATLNAVTDGGERGARSSTETAQDGGRDE